MKHRKLITLIAGAVISGSAIQGQAQQSQLGAPGAVRTQSNTLAPPPALKVPDASDTNRPIIRIPGKPNVDLTIITSGERAHDVYFATIKNIGTGTSGVSNLYCAANISTPGGGGYVIERVYVAKPLAPNAIHVFTCDFKVSKGEFNSAQGAVKPGEKIFDVHFIINNHKQIVETNYDNNDVRVKPGIFGKPVKPGKD